jgi:prepilin peptidase CpaA
MIVLAESPAYLLVLFLLSLVVAAAVDVGKRQVPNITVILVAVTGLAGFILTGNADQIWQPLAVAVAVILVGVPLFARQWVGGGDIKLLAATACWFSAKGALQLLAAVLLAGGVLAVLFLVFRLAGGRKISSTQQSGIPYAVAIAIGAALQVWQYRNW